MATLHYLDAADDPRLIDYRDLTDMDLRLRTEVANGVFMAEGFWVLERALGVGISPRSVLCLPKFESRVMSLLAENGVDTDVFVGTEEVLKTITGYRVHRGALAAMNRPPHAVLDTVVASGGDLLILEDLVDPTNVGLAIRSAAALGFTGVVISARCADPLYRRAVKASMGAVLGLPWHRSLDLRSSVQSLSDAGIDVLALTPDVHAPQLHAVLGSDVPRVGLLVGTEGVGLTSRLLAAARTQARIEMAPGVDSLNVAAAVAVAAYAVQTARRTR
ncbi:MAG: TrmH family RNA methyltransferase [Actinomycetes bacterium]